MLCFELEERDDGFLRERGAQQLANAVGALEVTAGAIISGGKGNAGDKIEKMKSCGIIVSDSPAEIGKTLYDKLAR